MSLYVSICLEAVQGGSIAKSKATRICTGVFRHELATHDKLEAV